MECPSIPVGSWQCQFKNSYTVYKARWNLPLVQLKFQIYNQYLNLAKGTPLKAWLAIMWKKKLFGLLLI